MGYAEADVRAAMSAAFNNPDRAFEYLNDGIPGTSASAPGAGAPAPAAAVSGISAGGMFIPPQGAAGGIPGLAPMPASDKFAAIRALPYFREMKQQIRENPSAIRAVLERVQRDNPDLLELINNNLDEFTSLLNEDDSAPAAGVPGMPAGGMPGLPGVDPQQLAMLLQQIQSMSETDRNSTLQSIGITPQQYNQLVAAIGAGALAGMAPPQPQQTIQLTPEENDAVNRLIEIFQLPREVVIQAYFACDKNEEYAASYLSEHGADF